MDRTSIKSVTSEKSVLTSSVNGTWLQCVEHFTQPQQHRNRPFRLCTEHLSGQGQHAEPLKKFEYIERDWNHTGCIYNIIEISNKKSEKFQNIWGKYVWETHGSKKKKSQENLE